MIEENGEQTLRVQPGTGAATGAGLDAGTDQEQTNRKTGDNQDNQSAEETNHAKQKDFGIFAGGTNNYTGTGEDSDSTVDYGAGDPANAAGGTTSSGAGSGTADRTRTGEGTTKAENDPMTRGAADTGEVTRNDRN